MDWVLEGVTACRWNWEPIISGWLIRSSCLVVLGGISHREIWETWTRAKRVIQNSVLSKHWSQVPAANLLIWLNTLSKARKWCKRSDWVGMGDCRECRENLWLSRDLRKRRRRLCDCDGLG